MQDWSQTTLARLPENKQSQSVAHSLHRAGQFAQYLFHAQVRVVTPTQFIVLAALEDGRGLTQTELVTRTGVDRSTLADVVRRMLQKGYLQKRRSAGDRRANVVRITVLGCELLDVAKPLVRAVEAKLLDAVSPARRHAFLEDLVAIASEHNQAD